MRLSPTAAPSVSISKVAKRDNIIAGLECHCYPGEGILPLDGDILFVSLEPGTIHGTHFPVERDWVRVLVLLPERTRGNDTVKKVLADDEKISILP